MFHSSASSLISLLSFVYSRYLIRGIFVSHPFSDAEATMTVVYLTVGGYTTASQVCNEVCDLVSYEDKIHPRRWYYFEKLSSGVYPPTVALRQDTYTLLRQISKRHFFLYTHPSTQENVLIINAVSHFFLVMNAVKFHWHCKHQHWLYNTTHVVTRSNERAGMGEVLGRINAVERVIKSLKGTYNTIFWSNEDDMFDINFPPACEECHFHNTGTIDYNGCIRCGAFQRPNGSLVIHDQPLIQDILVAVKDLGLCNNIGPQKFVAMATLLIHSPPKKQA